MPISEWFQKKEKYNQVSRVSRKRAVPDGVWSKCAHCSEIIYQKELQNNLWVCPKCNYPYPITAIQRLSLLVDDSKYDELDFSMTSIDPLKFDSEKPYAESIERSKIKTSLTEAVITARGSINGKKVVLAVMDFRFIGGSMGSVVGEKVTRAIEVARGEGLPFIAISSSGGARMQEGIFSLMQMAKTSAAIARFKETKLPFISVLTNPTMGGVMASFASLGDVIIAEPRSLVGFTGARVIEKTIGQKLPKGFQTAEFMLEYGHIDMVVERKNLKEVISKLLAFFLGDQS
ncbi:MAG: acetyl-CoA carboxylase, carboxyltransferase subunit beta [Actinomycetota bacterium]|nr:acetyl-CoA carboxylase, carboxyltransferase subunit beta [Actinomycetota bacterium]